MDFKAETLRLFIGMFVSGAGILLFNFVRIYHPIYTTNEMLFSAIGTILLSLLSFILLIDLVKKGG